MIIKPTSKCNFKCTFCSSTHLSEDNNEVVSLDEVDAFIKRFPHTSTVIVNGGDPLMMKPSYYWDIIDILDRYDCPANISFTSNLWAFYKKPSMWAPLFRHERVGVTTSFQYGDSRLKGDGTVYSEDDFVDVTDLFFKHVGYRPDFIAVIDKSNEHTIMQTVALAKRLGVEAKVNHAMASGPVIDNRGTLMGNVNTMYTQADIYEHYLAIFDAGLSQYEYNTQQMMVKLKNQHTTCPLSRNCDEGIRSIQPGGNYHYCGAFGDDLQYPIDFEKEMAGEFFTPLQEAPELHAMKVACDICPMFSICNGCKKTVSDTKRLGLVEHHCRKMKSLATRIIEANGMSGYLEPTPYEDESLPLIARG